MTPNIYSCLVERWSTPVPKRSSWDLTIILSFYRLSPRTFDARESKDFTLPYPQLKRWVFPQAGIINLVEILQTDFSNQIELFQTEFYHQT